MHQLQHVHPPPGRVYVHRNSPWPRRAVAAWSPWGTYSGLISGCVAQPEAASRQVQASSISLRFARFVDTLRAYMRVTIGSASLPKNPPIVGTS